MLCVTEVPVPVTTKWYVPGAAVPASSVSVERAPELIGLGLNEAEAPLGTPEMERWTD